MRGFVLRNKRMAVLASIFLFIGGEATFRLVSAERYGLTAVFLIALAVIASAFVLACKDSEHPSKHTALAKLWEMPLTTTRTALLMKAGTVVLVCLTLYLGLNYDSWEIDGKINLSLMIVDGMKVLLWLPLIYWLFRKQYSPESSNQLQGNKVLLHKSERPKKSSHKETLIAVFAFGIAFVALSIIGMWLT